MAEKDIDTLKSALPGVFQDRQVSESLIDDWIYVDIINPDKPSGRLENSETKNIDQVTIDDLIDEVIFNPNDDPRGDLADTVGDLSSAFDDDFPGGPQPLPPDWNGSTDGLSPEVLAFYLPFHYYHPNWWGVYLIMDGVLLLAIDIYRYAHRNGGAANPLSPKDCWTAARLFLFYHEIFHHKAETFATRMEVAHRQSVYTTGMKKAYQGACLEEGLAEAYALQRLNSKAFFPDANKRRTIMDALYRFVNNSPPAYKAGLGMVDQKSFNGTRNQLSEDALTGSIALPAMSNPQAWDAAKYLYNGFNDKAKGRAKYMVKRGSKLAARIPLDVLPRIRARDLKKALKAVGCYFLRDGANHEVWKSKLGKRFSIPRHPGDMSNDTIRKIISQAGISMGLNEFISTYG